MRVHYTADPAKDPDTPEGMRWLKAELSGVPGGMASAKWQQEYEINFAAGDGEKVWPAFDSKMRQHISCDPFEIEPHLPVHCGLDWGIACSTVLTAHAVESMDRIYQIDEIVMNDTPDNPLSVKKFADEVKGRYWWDQVQSIVGDPNIWNRLPRANETTSISIGDMFSDEGLYVGKGRNEAGVDMAYVTMLNTYMWNSLENPRFMIFNNCVKTLKCYSRLRKKQNLSVRDPDKDPPEKIVSKNVDEFDANKYIHLALGFTEPEDVREMPGTFEWHVRRLEEQARMEMNILR